MNGRTIRLVALQTIRQQVQSRLFWIMTLVLPAIIVVVSVIAALTETRVPQGPLGVVDRSGQLTIPISDQEDGLPLVAQPDEAEGQRALASGELQGLLVVPEDYLASGHLQYHAVRQPASGLEWALNRFLRRALAPDAPPWLADRLSSDPAWSYEDLASGRVLSSGLEAVLWGLLPMALGMMFMLMLSTTLSSVGPAIVAEREDRSLEMVLTSLRPSELLAGKLLGLTALTLLQLAVWLLVGLGALALGWWRGGQGGLPALRWSALLWAALLGGPGYLLYAALAACLAILAGGREQARQLSGLLVFLVMAPMFLTGFVFMAPDGALAKALTLVPFTAPSMALLRMMMTEVPLWQLLVALALLWVSAALCIWLAARLFRALSLLYGQRLSPRALWRAFLGRTSSGAGRMG
ncbi:MAG: ABC transporter permease [Anaerolineae bacterium]|jgi:ABC-2 type transport system permease protein|nr:ABC transporter permease [Chloroflexota bacterium]